MVDFLTSSAERPSASCKFRGPLALSARRRGCDLRGQSAARHGSRRSATTAAWGFLLRNACQRAPKVRGDSRDLLPLNGYSNLIDLLDGGRSGNPRRRLPWVKEHRPNGRFSKRTLEAHGVKTSGIVSNGSLTGCRERDAHSDATTGPENETALRVTRAAVWIGPRLVRQVRRITSIDLSEVARKAAEEDLGSRRWLRKSREGQRLPVASRGHSCPARMRPVTVHLSFETFGGPALAELSRSTSGRCHACASRFAHLNRLGRRFTRHEGDCWVIRRSKPLGCGLP